MRGLCLFGLCIIVPVVITFTVTGVVPEQEDVISGKFVRIQYAHTTKNYDIEEFIKMVLADKFLQSEQPELLKAESIILRTNLYRALGTETWVDGEQLGVSYLTKQKMRQKWGKEYDRKYALIEQAAAATAGQVLTYQGQLIDARYTPVSSGETLSGEELLGTEYPYLIRVPCQDDLASDLYLQSNTMTRNEIVQKLTDKYEALRLPKETLLKNIQIISKAQDGTVLKLQVGNVILSGIEFAQILKIPSANFALAEEGNHIKITTKGVGENIGVSLYTANIMAELGNTYDSILNKFYKDVIIMSVDAL